MGGEWGKDVVDNGAVLAAFSPMSMGLVGMTRPHLKRVKLFEAGAVRTPGLIVSVRPNQHKEPSANPPTKYPLSFPTKCEVDESSKKNPPV